MDFSGKRFPKEVKGKWCYLYRIFDKDGDIINFHLSETREHKGAFICIHGAIRIARFIQDTINSDGNAANERAVRVIPREHNFQKI